MVFGEGAQVRYAIPLNYNNPNEGGGPIRRTPLVAERIHAVTMVRRTPHQFAWDAEPGGANEPQLWVDKFLPDGRIVQAAALGATALESRVVGLAIWSLGGGAVLGAFFGAATAPSGMKLRRAGLGSLVGFLTGAFLGGLAGRTAALTKEIA
jgi:hypothetical protein